MQDIAWLRTVEELTRSITRGMADLSMYNYYMANWQSNIHIYYHYNNGSHPGSNCLGWHITR